MTRRASSPSSSRRARSDCPIACTLDLIGDRWTLLIVRDLLFGKHRFSEFLASAEDIKTNVLAERLKRLERAGLVQRSRYRERPPRYEYRLTDQGRDLSPVLEAMFTWGRAHLSGAATARRGRAMERRLARAEP
jgi:DNA-binding HxlR family transcriptional regulator